MKTNIKTGGVSLMATRTRKLFLIVATCAFMASQTLAQEPTFNQGDNVVSLGVGIGGTLYSGYGYLGRDFSRLPTFSLAYERCIIGNLFNDKSSLGVGGLVGYTTAKYWGWRSTDLMIGVRGALHYAFVDKLDTYAGAMFGYNINSWKWDGKGSEIHISGSSGLAYAVFAGGRYYLADAFAAFAEVGYGYTIINVGISLKF